MTMATSTVRLHRVLRTNPDKIYRAFLDAEAIARWLPPNGFTCRVDQLDARVGGSFRAHWFTNSWRTPSRRSVTTNTP
jgi:uncharacterized protein YndB with AHSA1/START domain